MDEIRAALTPLAEALEALGVDYRIGGSVASSVLGVARSTLDVDLVAALEERHVPALIAKLGAAYYADAGMMLDAIRRRDAFNVIHLETMLKLDVFIPKARAFDEAAFARSTTERLGDESDSREFPFTTAEDIVLHKLEWFRLGGGHSKRQWEDVLGVLKLQGSMLDSAYLDRWAPSLGVADLLALAREEAGVTPAG